MRILYFAAVRDRIGLDGETLDVPLDVTTPDALADWLARRSPDHAAALDDRTRLRCAVDQVMAGFDQPLGDATEVAFFPPVTGG